jgi:16S rRNA (cytosine1402-N4)-methyltransferase
MQHVPVLVDAVVAALSGCDGTVVDGTFGRGGHSRALLKSMGPDGRLLVIDRDEAAIACAQELSEEDSRVHVVKGNFSELPAILKEQKLAGVSGILLDLGTSSPQLDDAARGFSFMVDGPLDMRMDQSADLNAEGWLSAATPEEMAKVFFEYGEEKYSRRIARAIVEFRAREQLKTTLQLVHIIRDAQPRADKNKHAATRVFQAIRIHINDELGAVQKGLAGCFEVLEQGGKLAVISFHSLEDRIVKHTFRGWAKGDVPRRLPVVGEVLGKARLLVRMQRASEKEISENPRSRSAILRVVEKLV